MCFRPIALLIVGEPAMLVFTLKRIDPITEYASTLPLASVCHDRAVRSHNERAAFGISCRINLPPGFLHFSLSHSFRRDFWQLDAAGSRAPAASRLVSTESFRLRSNKPTRNFPLPRATLWPVGRGGEKVEACLPSLHPRVLHLHLALLGWG